MTEDRLRVKRLSIIFLVLLVCGACSRREPSDNLIIFHAGSLALPMQEIEREFESKHTGLNILRECAGSQKCARKIIDLKKPCDIMVSSDYRVIERLLIPEYAGWNILFASNQMVLAYTDKSRFADEINEDNWFEILSRPEVVWGHGEPDLDPCGYRALFVLQLAERFYQRPGLYRRMMDNRPIENVRPKAEELIPLLQTGNMDYAWEYLSVAVQHGLKFIELPQEINLSNPEYDQFYSHAVVELAGKRPGEKMLVRGESITYGVTLIKDAPNHEAALLFLQYLLDPEGGLRVLKEMGQPPYIPSLLKPSEALEEIPPELISLVTVAAQ